MDAAYTPRGKKRTALLRMLKPIFCSHRSRPISEVISEINPVLRGWVQYFAVGHSSRVLLVHSRLGREEDSAPFGAGQAASRFRLESGGGVVVWDARSLRGVPSGP